MDHKLRVLKMELKSCKKKIVFDAKVTVATAEQLNKPSLKEVLVDVTQILNKWALLQPK